jgi:hypothetical protein
MWTRRKFVTAAAVGCGAGLAGVLPKAVASPQISRHAFDAPRCDATYTKYTADEIRDRIRYNALKLELNWGEKDIETLTQEVAECQEAMFDKSSIFVGRVSIITLVDEFMCAWKKDAIKEGALHFGYVEANERCRTPYQGGDHASIVQEIKRNYHPRS